MEPTRTGGDGGANASLELEADEEKEVYEGGIDNSGGR
jgi:hypothetical protein